MNSSLADTWNDDIACMGNHFDQTQASLSWVTLQLFMRSMRMLINANPPYTYQACLHGTADLYLVIPTKLLLKTAKWLLIGESLSPKHSLC